MAGYGGEKEVLDGKQCRAPGGVPWYAVKWMGGLWWKYGGRDGVSSGGEGHPSDEYANRIPNPNAYLSTPR